MELTKDADKMICCIYKSFLQSRKDGNPKPSARCFEDDYFSTDKVLSSWLEDDLTDTLLEIARAGLVKIYIGGNFELTDRGISNKVSVKSSSSQDERTLSVEK